MGPSEGRGIGIGEEGGDRSSCCWMPPTPYRPILTRPEPKLQPEIATASRPLAFGVEETQENRVVIDLDPDPEEESGFVYHEAGAGAGVESSTDAYFCRVAQWRDVPCKELMILAVASANDGSGGAVLGDTQHEFSFPDNHPYDLNVPPPTTYGQFAPITPDKSMRVDNVQMSQIPSSNTDDGRGQEIEEQWDANSATINIIDLENNKDIEKSAVDSSQATFSTQLQEHCNPDKEVNIIIDLNNTPQPKQRKRKHRPKVIIEGKPKRNPQPSGSMENPKPKRKYVRKSTLEKNKTPPPQESTEHIDSNNVKPPKRSCRRTLNYADTEEPIDGISSSKSFNVGSQSQEMNVGTDGVQSNSTGPRRNEVELVADNTQAGIAQDLVRSTSRMLKHYLSLPDQQPPITPQQIRGSTTYVNSQKEAAEEIGQMSTCSEQANTAQTMLDCDARSSLRNDSTCSTTTVLATEEEQSKRSKRNYSNAVKQADPRTGNLFGANYNNLPAYYNVMSWVHFPYIYKKKRTDKAQNSTIPSTSYRVTMAENVWRPSTAGYLTSGPQVNADNFSTALGEAGKTPQERPQGVHSFLPLYQTERSTKRRSSCPTRVRDLASLTRTPEHILHRTCLVKQPTDGNGQRVNHFDRSQTCIDALVTDVGATLAKKKRTKRNPVSSSQRGLVIYQNQQSFATASGVPPEVPFEQLLSAITEHLKCLNINRENSSRFAYQGYNVISSYKARYQEHNALVLYRGDGTIVPFDGSFDPIKKRKARPKVDLDEETDRVWKLLLENINSEGINGTDQEKEKWWEEERRVFHGRADNFIARMHLVQGDRRFSPWKGSVLDSVVGVFLTQNVSDHLSSSAFMSMAAHFPLKSRSNERSCDEEVASLVVDEPEVCISENSNQPGCDWSSLTFHDAEHSEEKVVNGNENSGSTTEGVISTNEAECKLSHPSESGPGLYPNSLMNRSTTKITRTGSYLQEDMRTYDVVSSQNSVDSSTSQTVEKTGSCESNSETEYPPNRCENSSLDHSTSFVELLQRAESSMLHYSLKGTHMSPHDTSYCGGYQPACMQHNDQRREINREEASRDPSSNCCLNLTPNPGVRQVECFDLFAEVTESSYTSKNKCEDSMSERSVLTAESPSQDTINNKLTANVQEAPKCSRNSSNNIQVGNNMAESQLGWVGNLNNVDIHSQEQNNKIQQSCLNISGGTTDVRQKAAELGLNEQSNSVSKEFTSTNAATSKTKNRRAGKENKDQQDWDKLRKQAESNGKKREKTENTMDSLDWEAVRCADVNEIAQTIKERGMNNMLAERIKDFLNRLHREHGSVNLEWLRDVPPDQAKEYLLSFRGLGLKSVECVRLLTLHHLAFPVDTNVGRIAVRLGWVPLQPLPESLQLHLLELYPVLESIQKYLWPRLCKLDQRTLYELHYQMITFGKVFCTKSKPNCNACPLRAECRHFASAFASARLALPGPEEQSIVSATEDRTTHPNRAGINNRMPLPFPQATYQQLEASQKSEVKSTVGHCEPTTYHQLEASEIAEVKAAVGNCEPIIEEPASPEPVCTQISEDIEDFCDDPDEIPTIKLNIEEFTQTLQNYMEKNMELQEGDMSKALVSLTPEAASLPTPKLKNVSRLRTEHQVYELPDTHPLLEMLHMDKREPDDPCNYLLAIWTPGETPNSIQPPEKRCSSQELGRLCDDNECFSCNSSREANSQTVRGTLLIPCRTAMRGSFPLNGTYFQVNEVFADHDSSINPIDVPRAWLWKLNRRTVYFGTSIPTIFKGLSTPEIQQCFWRGFVCVRGFDQKTRAPRPLLARLHFPASKLARTKDKREE